MTRKEVFHLSAEPDDFEGNQGAGRYILLPGSDGRAAQIASRLNGVRVKENERRLNCYFGEYQGKSSKLDIAVVSTGMGCPSMDIVLNELLVLGASSFLRVGTAGSLQSDSVRYGDYVIAQGAVRDEATSRNYAPIELPALADFTFVQALQKASEATQLTQPSLRVHTGIVHCKDSLYAREFGKGPLAAENKRYMDVLSECGVLASEMETSQLFIRCQLAATEHMRLSKMNGSAGPALCVPAVRAGSLLAVIGDCEPFAKRNHDPVISGLIELGLLSLECFHLALFKGGV